MEYLSVTHLIVMILILGVEQVCELWQIAQLTEITTPPLSLANLSTAHTA
jgi:hypothetical protein